MNFYPNTMFIPSPFKVIFFPSHYTSFLDSILSIIFIYSSLFCIYFISLLPFSIFPPFSSFIFPLSSPFFPFLPFSFTFLPFSFPFLPLSSPFFPFLPLSFLFPPFSLNLSHFSLSPFSYFSPK